LAISIAEKCGIFFTTVIKLINMKCEVPVASKRKLLERRFDASQVLQHFGGFKPLK
jgi:hypothetical protein